MWIVRLALRRPYSFHGRGDSNRAMGVVSIWRMANDIFPKIDIPVSVIWSFPGEAPEEMEKRLVTLCERAMTTTVNDIEHIESQSYNGVALSEINAPIVVPADAFLFHRGGAQIVTVTDGNRIHVQKIRVGRDFGTQLEVLDGLVENTRVVINPNDDLFEGLQVQVKTPQDPKLNPVAAMPAPSGTPAVAAK
jgi:AcrB/AcrD/AcrF family